MIIDEALFKRTLEVVALKVSKNDCQKVVKTLRTMTLHRPKVKPVVKLEDGMLVLLDEKTFDSADKIGNMLKGIKYETLKHELAIGYQNTTLTEALSILLPNKTEYPSAFESLGHIAHLNLRDEYLPHKQLIAQVLCDKTPSIKTVVNKVSAISSEFRTYEMELLAGPAEYTVLTKENGFSYRFDIREVYFNSRLGMEHLRIVDAIKLRSKEKKTSPFIVCDFFCGVGPFAIPIATLDNVEVVANDLNPACAKSLKHNLKLNKVKETKIKVMNEDGMNLISEMCKGNIEGDCVIMNLPHAGLDMIKLFKVFDEKVQRLPRVYCYCFWLNTDKVSLKKRVETELGAELLEENQLAIRKIRDVSTRKYMMCIEFQLTERVIERGQPSKRQKLDDSINA